MAGQAEIARVAAHAPKTRQVESLGGTMAGRIVVSIPRVIELDGGMVFSAHLKLKFTKEGHGNDRGGQVMGQEISPKQIVIAVEVDGLVEAPDTFEIFPVGDQVDPMEMKHGLLEFDLIAQVIGKDLGPIVGNFTLRTISQVLECHDIQGAGLGRLIGGELLQKIGIGTAENYKKKRES